MMLGKLQRAHPTLRGHFAPAYLVGNNILRAYLFYIYEPDTKLSTSYQEFHGKIASWRERVGYILMCWWNLKHQQIGIKNLIKPDFYDFVIHSECVKLLNSI